MKIHLSQRVLKHLGTLSVAVAFGVVPGASLLRIPREVVTALVEEVEGDETDFTSEDRKRVLRLLSDDPRVLVRRRVAEATQVLWPDAPDDTQQLLRKLAKDPSPRVRTAAARSLAAVLSAASPLERVEIVCRWTVASASSERLAVAKALATTTPLLVTDMALEQLAADRDAGVRQSAVRAVALHFEENPDTYAKLALSLIADENREVRRIARRLVARRMAQPPESESV